MLELRNVTKIYNAGTMLEQRLFQDFSLKVEEGQFVAVVGGNGSGKTTMLNIICGSIPIEAGDVLVEGRSILKLKDYQRYASMGRVYQDPSAGTCPNLTMLENLSLADNKGKSFGLRRGVDRRRIDGYREQNIGRLKVTSETTGESLKDAPYIELHDIVCNYLKGTD